MTYFIQVGEDGPIKIGKTSGLAESRLADLQIGNPRKLRLLAVTDECERCLHRQFAHLRGQGEWHEPGPDLIAYIEGLGPPGDQDSESVADLKRARLASGSLPDDPRERIIHLLKNSPEGINRRTIFRKIRRGSASLQRLEYIMAELRAEGVARFERVVRVKGRPAEVWHYCREQQSAAPC